MSNSLGKMTVAEFRKRYKNCGESVMGLAFIAMHVISDDEEFRKAAVAAIEAEDKFDKMCDERDIQR